MRYITDENDYLKEVAFGCLLSCGGYECTEYTGSVPSGYTSLENWYLNESEKLYRWKIVNGELTLDSSATAPAVRIPSGAALYKNAGSDRSVSQSYNYFHASYDDSWATDYEYGHLSVVSKTITWADRSSKVKGIQVAADAPAGYLLLTGNIRYLKSTAANSGVQTSILRTRAGTTSEFTWICGTYGNERISHVLSQIIPVEPGDFISLGGYKTAADIDLKVVDGISSRWGALWVD